MLIDYVPIERLPWVVVWLDWCFYAHRSALGACILASCVLYCYKRFSYGQGPFWATGGGDASLVLFVAFCAWVVYCALRNGFAVG